MWCARLKFVLLIAALGWPAAVVVFNRMDDSCVETHQKVAASFRSLQELFQCTGGWGSCKADSSLEYWCCVPPFKKSDRESAQLHHAAIQSLANLVEGACSRSRKRRPARSSLSEQQWLVVAVSLTLHYFLCAPFPSLCIFRCSSLLSLSHSLTQESVYRACLSPPLSVSPPGHRNSLSVSAFPYCIDATSSFVETRLASSQKWHADLERSNLVMLFNTILQGHGHVQV